MKSVSTANSFLSACARRAGVRHRRAVVTPTGRIGEQARLLELDPLEGWTLTRWRTGGSQRRRSTGARSSSVWTAAPSLGWGMYRALTLAGHLLDHELLFLMRADLPMGVELVQRSHYPLRAFTGDAVAAIRACEAQVVINDILDTDLEYVRALRDLGLFVVNFEDLGRGNRAAHLVINALYNPRFPEAHMHWGRSTPNLHDEFYRWRPSRR
jgi:hypothetical protein